jgi:hypothetical protein
MKIGTLQEAKAASFRGAYRGLRSQKWEQAFIGDTCALRSKDGKCCAVGWLIPEKHIARITENLGIFASFADVTDDGFLADPLAEWFKSAPRKDRIEFKEFLGELQAIHDENEIPSEMERGFEELRTANGWPVP